MSWGYLFLHVMKGKPRLQDGTVTVDTDKNKLVGILILTPKYICD